MTYARIDRGAQSKPHPRGLVLEVECEGRWQDHLRLATDRGSALCAEWSGNERRVCQMISQMQQVGG